MRRSFRIAEQGRMRRRVREIFRAGYPVLETIPLRGGGEFLEEIRRQTDVIKFIVNIENRGALPAQLAAMLPGAPG